MADVEHTIGLLLGTEDDWPRAYEALLRRVGVITDDAGRSHRTRSVRVTIEPFNLRARPQHDLVIDRLAYWYYHPREWLKKIALMDDVYLLNSPFTFQSMEKHAAYCAMIRLGLKVPETVLVPFKNPLDNSRYAYTSSRYNQPFDLEALAETIGYPMFMKPYDGGAWVGVSKIRNAAELHAAYDASGERLMHLQAAVEDYDVFARSLTIGPETMVMKFRPELPMHERYAVDHNFLGERVGDEVVTISRLVNAFFRWEFNSCESLVKGTRSTTRTPAPTWRSPRCTTTSRGRWPRCCAGRSSAWSPTASPASTWTPPRTSPSATTRTCRTRRSCGSTAGSPTTTSRRRSTRSSARNTCHTSTRWCTAGSAPRSSARC
jgi:hypothetical protein